MSGAFPFPRFSNNTLVYKLVLGVDLFEGTGVKDYLKTMSARPAVQKVAADRKTSTEQMMAANKK